MPSWRTSVARLLDRSASAALDELEAEARSSDDPLAYATITGWLKLHIESLRINPTCGPRRRWPCSDWIIDRVAA